MMHPVLHMTISMDEEAVLYICTTIICAVIAKAIAWKKENK